MLIPRASEDQALADMLAEIGVRYTRIASVAMDEPSRMVVTHDRNGAAEAAEYLLSLGHTDIALITGPSAYRSSHERTSGFVDALAQRGIELPKSRIIEAGYTFESGVAAAEKLLSGKQRPTAIFTGNDEMAAGAYKVLVLFEVDHREAEGIDDRAGVRGLQPGRRAPPAPPCRPAATTTAPGSRTGC